MRVCDRSIVMAKRLVGSTLLTLHRNALAERANTGLLLLCRLHRHRGAFARLLPWRLRLLLLRLSLLTANFPCLGRHGNSERKK